MMKVYILSTALRANQLNGLIHQSRYLTFNGQTQRKGPIISLGRLNHDMLKTTQLYRSTVLWIAVAFILDTPVRSTASILKRS